MQSETSSVTQRKPSRWQSPRHPFDRRTKAARRFAALVSEFCAQLTVSHPISEARMTTVRQLAGVILQLEAMQAEIVRGEPVDAEQHVRLANLQTRLMRQLGLDKAEGKPKPRTLADHLADRESGRAA